MNQRCLDFDERFYETFLRWFLPGFYLVLQRLPSFFFFRHHHHQRHLPGDRVFATSRYGLVQVFFSSQKLQKKKKWEPHLCEKKNDEKKQKRNAKIPKQNKTKSRKEEERFRDYRWLFVVFVVVVVVVVVVDVVVVVV